MNLSAILSIAKTAVAIAAPKSITPAQKKIDAVAQVLPVVNQQLEESGLPKERAHQIADHSIELAYQLMKVFGK